MLKLCRDIKVKVLFLVLVYVFNLNLFEFSAAILEKGLFRSAQPFCPPGSAGKNGCGQGFDSDVMYVLHKR